MNELLDHAVGVGSVVNDSEGIDQVKRFYWQDGAQFFCTSTVETDPILQAKYFRANSGDVQRPLGQVHGDNRSAVASKIHCVGDDSTPNFKDFLVTPRLE